MSDIKYPEINETTRQYWETVDFQKLHKAQSIWEIYEVAKNILSRMPETLAQVCGPITSGGKGSIEENLNYLNDSIQELQKQGIHIFDQMPFEETFHRIVREKTYSQTYENILIDFYEPIFQSGKIKTLYFIPGWENSTGAKWEYAQAKALGIKTVFL